MASPPPGMNPQQTQQWATDFQSRLRREGMNPANFGFGSPAPGQPSQQQPAGQAPRPAGDFSAYAPGQAQSQQSPWATATPYGQPAMPAFGTPLQGSGWTKMPQPSAGSTGTPPVQGPTPAGRNPWDNISVTASFAPGTSQEYMAERLDNMRRSIYFNGGSGIQKPSVSPRLAEYRAKFPGVPDDKLHQAMIQDDRRREQAAMDSWIEQYGDQSQLQELEYRRRNQRQAEEARRRMEEQRRRDDELLQNYDDGGEQPVWDGGKYVLPSQDARYDPQRRREQAIRDLRRQNEFLEQQRQRMNMNRQPVSGGGRPPATGPRLPSPQPSGPAASFPQDGGVQPMREEWVAAGRPGYDPRTAGNSARPATAWGGSAAEANAHKAWAEQQARLRPPATGPRLPSPQPSGREAPVPQDGDLQASYDAWVAAGKPGYDPYGRYARVADGWGNNSGESHAHRAWAEQQAKRSRLR